MGIVAIVPAADIVSANEALDLEGFGPSNFSVPAYIGPEATHAALHCWDHPDFEDAVLGIPNVVVQIGEGDPVARTQALIEAQGATWGAQAEDLPDEGMVYVGEMYRSDDKLWTILQQFDRTAYGDVAIVYPSMIRRVRHPYIPEPWHRPIDQFDTCVLVNNFTGKPDRTIWADYVLETIQDQNSHSPEENPAGWRVYVEGADPVDPEPEPDTVPEWVQPIGAHDAYNIGDQVTFEGEVYKSLMNGNTYSPTAYPQGWALVEV